MLSCHMGRGGKENNRTRGIGGEGMGFVGSES
jgi:hypothetical protein